MLGRDQVLSLSGCSKPDRPLEVAPEVKRQATGPSAAASGAGSDYLIEDILDPRLHLPPAPILTTQQSDSQVPSQASLKYTPGAGIACDYVSVAKGSLRIAGPAMALPHENIARE